MNILVIEDQPTDLRLMRAVLQGSGYVVHARSSAEGALDAISNDPPDLILLDLRLPGMDGLSLARRLKKDESTRHIPIIAITAALEKFSEAETLAAGCDAFIRKPLNTRNLPEQVEACLKSSQQGESG